MAYKVKFRCPEINCRHEFTLVMEAGDKLPDWCPSCRAWVGEDENAPPKLFAIGGSDTAKAVNKMYKDVEETSQYRAEAAGAPDLKVTNMKDHVEIGETSLIPVRNKVTEVAEEIQKINRTSDPYFNSAIGQTIQVANQGPGAKKGVNLGLTAIQEKVLPNVSAMTSPIALNAGFGGRR